jgi:hypothetical protein
MADNVYQEIDELITKVIQRLQALQAAIDAGDIEDAEGPHIGITNFLNHSLNALDADAVALLNKNQRKDLMNRAFEFPNIDLPDGGVYEGFHLAMDLQRLFDDIPFQPPQQNKNPPQPNQQQGGKKRKTRKSKKSKKTRKTKRRKSLRRKH